MWGSRAWAQVHTACWWAAQGFPAPRSHHVALGSWGKWSPLFFPGGDGHLRALMEEEKGQRGLGEGPLQPLCRGPGLQHRGVRLCECAGIGETSGNRVAEMFPQATSPSATVLAEGCYLEGVY